MAYLLDNSNGRFLSSSISLLTCAGASLLTIPCSHTLEALNFVLGDFAYLSANLANRRTTATIQETGETVAFTAADQILIQGALKSGAVASIHYRGGAAKGGIDYHWEIEGEQGIIMFKGSNGPQVLDIFFTLPERKLTRLKRILPAMYLNGEQIQHREDKEDRLGNIGREYEAFAEKDPAHYVDFDHAVARHKIIEAIEQSSKADGKRINF